MDVNLRVLFAEQNFGERYCGQRSASRTGSLWEISNARLKAMDDLPTPPGRLNRAWSSQRTASVGLT